MRKLAITLSVLATAAALPASAGAATAPPDVRQIVDDLIVCVMAPCP